ncbi:MAG TPA: adenylate/guanylate cyclase domain-containing protein [Saprospiraceae bacterium]|nr:adenylate/guanylate cyclase domain-containing protein [Saprospiraceae bacterium]
MPFKKQFLPLLLSLLFACPVAVFAQSRLDEVVTRLNNAPADTAAWSALHNWFDTTGLAPQLLSAQLDRWLATVPEDNPRLRAELYRQAGIVRMDLGEFQPSTDYLLQAMRLFEAQSDAFGIALTRVNFGSVNYYLNQYKEAIDYWQQAAGYFAQKGPFTRLALAYSNIGSAYAEMSRLDSAEAYHRRAMQISEQQRDLKGLARAWNNLGVTYEYRKKYDDALRCYAQALQLSEKMSDQAGSVRAILNAAAVLTYQSRFDEALAANQEAIERLKGCREKSLYRLAYLNMADLYRQTGRYREAFDALDQYHLYKDSIMNEDNTRYVQDLQILYETEKKEHEIAELNRKSESQAFRLNQQRLLMTGLALFILLLGALVWIAVSSQRRTTRLLHNILPVSVAAELRQTGSVKPRRYEAVTVLFADLVGFTELGHVLSPEELVRLIDRYYHAFDSIIDRYGLEKIKTIGDSYMCASGLPQPNPKHAETIFLAARDMLRWVEQDARQSMFDHLQLRVGIHSGPVVAGVAGKIKYAYDIWGDTVNIAARMEQFGVPGKINLSNATRALLDPSIVTTLREPVVVKGLGLTNMYLSD